MDEYANCGTIALKVCDLTDHQNAKSMSNELQCNAKQDLITILKKFSNDIHII